MRTILKAYLIIILSLVALDGISTYIALNLYPNDFYEAHPFSALAMDKLGINWAIIILSLFVAIVVIAMTTIIDKAYTQLSKKTLNNTKQIMVLAIGLSIPIVIRLLVVISNFYILIKRMMI